MKKIFCLMMMCSMCFVFGGCSNSNSEEIAEEVQSKIEKTGWKLKLERDAGTEVDYLLIEIDEYNSFNIVRDKKEDSISSISYSDGPELDEYTVHYDFNEKENTFIHNSASNGMTCAMYDLTNGKEADDIGNVSKCTSDEIDYANLVMKKRDSELNDAGIAINDMEVWARWYYNNN